MTNDENSSEKAPVAPSGSPAPGPLSAVFKAAQEGTGTTAPAAPRPEPVPEAPAAPQDVADPTAAVPAQPPAPIEPPMPDRKPSRRRGRGPRKDKEDGDEAQYHHQPAFVPPKSMELGRRGRLSATEEAEINAALGDLSLEAMGEVQPKTAAELEPDSRHRSQVIEVHGDDVFFNLGGKAQGVISVRAFPEPPEVGSMIDVVITGYNAEDDLYELMVPGGRIVVGDWSNIQEGSIVEAKVTGSNAGGLECQVNDLRGFIPAGQVGLYYTENLADYVDQRLVCVITQADERRGNLILSRRAVLEREKEESRAKLMAELQPGDVVEGVVRKLMDFGAFVELGSGVDGLIHISQMSWDRIKHPSELLAEGQKVKVRIEKIDPETGKIGLTLRNPEEHPWANIEQRFAPGTLIKGPVSRIAQFGAFVKLAPGIEGLIHISELAHHKVYRVDTIVKEGDEVECKVMTVDADNQRIGLSLKAAQARTQKESAPVEPEVEEPKREAAIKRSSNAPLKGGSSRNSGGEQFGLKW